MYTYIYDQILRLSCNNIVVHLLLFLSFSTIIIVATRVGLKEKWTVIAF